MKRSGICLLGLLAGCSAAGPTDTTDTATAAAETDANTVLATIPACSAGQIQEFDDSWNYGQGVLGRDPVGERIGTYAAYKHFPFGKNWYPASTIKRTLCGQLGEFGYYDGLGGEYDWNIHLMPSAHHMPLFTDHLAGVSSSDIKDCGGGTDNCMEAEVTPDEHWYGNRWFTREGTVLNGVELQKDTSALLGKGLCTYGAHITEEAHGDRPEIHPSELLWWREKVAEGPYYLMTVQDDSNRYDDDDEFALPDTKPSWWRPWAQWPRSAEFRVGFKTSLAPITAPTYSVQELDNRNVFTDTKDSDNGQTHALEHNGRILVRVNETTASDAKVGVDFSDVCRMPNNEVRGYVKLTSKVGKGESGDEGYQVLKVTRTVAPSVVASQPVAVERASVAMPTIRVTEVNGTLRGIGLGQLEGDLKVEVVANEDSPMTPAIAAVREVTKLSRRPLALESMGGGGAGASPALGVLHDVKMERGASLELELASGHRTQIGLPEVAMAPRLRAVTHGEAMDEAAWGSVATAIHADKRSAAPAGRLMATRQQTIELSPAYGVRKGNDVLGADGTPLVEELNELVARGDQARIKELFGTDSPFGVRWTFTGENVATGAPVAVRVGGSATSDAHGAIVVRLSGAPGHEDRVEVTFPEGGGALYTLRAVAHVVDAKGNAGEVRRAIVSHELAIDAGSIRGVLGSVAELAGVSAADFVATSEHEVTSEADLRDPRVRLATSAHIQAVHASEKGRLSVAKLAGLVDLAKRFAQTGSSDPR